MNLGMAHEHTEESCSCLVCSLLCFGGGLHFLLALLRAGEMKYSMHRGGCQTIYHLNKAEVVLGPSVALLFTTLSSPGAKFEQVIW